MLGKAGRWNLVAHETLALLLAKKIKLDWRRHLIFWINDFPAPSHWWKEFFDFDVLNIGSPILWWRQGGRGTGSSVGSSNFPLRGSNTQCVSRLTHLKQKTLQRYMANIYLWKMKWKMNGNTVWKWSHKIFFECSDPLKIIATDSPWNKSCKNCRDSSWERSELPFSFWSFSVKVSIDLLESYFPCHILENYSGKTNIMTIHSVNLSGFFVQFHNCPLFR